MDRTYRLLLPWTALLLGLVVAAGCEQPNHRAAVARRQENLNRTVALLQDIENERPAKMQRMANTLARQHAHDVDRCQANGEALDRAIRAEFDRWEQRQGVYRQRLNELMQGDPANIDRTLPWVLY
jgi:hypothetical protein